MTSTASESPSAMAKPRVYIFERTDGSISDPQFRFLRSLIEQHGMEHSSWTQIRKMSVGEASRAIEAIRGGAYDAIREA